MLVDMERSSLSVFWVSIDLHAECVKRYSQEALS